jgi:hypothetical protein
LKQLISDHACANIKAFAIASYNTKVVLLQSIYGKWIRPIYAAKYQAIIDKMKIKKQSIHHAQQKRQFNSFMSNQTIINTKNVMM